MTPLVISILCLAMVGTSFLSGIFGMAGGMILVGILLAMMPVPEAMMLHGVTQMASNGWRGLLWWRHVRWSAVGSYVFGCLIALAVWSFTRYVPSTPVALLLLGLTPFLVRLAPKDYRPNPESLRQGSIYGVGLHDAHSVDRRRRPADRPVLPWRQARPPRDRRHQGDLPDLRAWREAHLFRQPDRSDGFVRSHRCGACNRQLDDRHDPRQAGARGDDATSSTAAGPTASSLRSPDTM